MRIRGLAQNVQEREREIERERDRERERERVRLSAVPSRAGTPLASMLLQSEAWSQRFAVLTCREEPRLGHGIIAGRRTKLL